MGDVCSSSTYGWLAGPIACTGPCYASRFVSTDHDTILTVNVKQVLAICIYVRASSIARSKQPSS